MHDYPHFVYQGPPVMMRTNPDSGFLETGRWHINVATGEIVSRFAPGEGELLLDGREIKKSDYPELFEILKDSAIIVQRTEDTFTLPDLRGRVITGEERHDHAGER